MDGMECLAQMLPWLYKQYDLFRQILIGSYKFIRSFDIWRFICHVW